LKKCNYIDNYQVLRNKKLKGYKEEMMKKIIIFFIFIFLLSSCVLVPAVPSTPQLPTQTYPVSPLFPTEVIKPTGTPNEQVPPTETPVFTSTPLSTFTSQPTASKTPTEKPTLTYTPQFTATPFPFEVQVGTPAYIQNFAHPTEGCNWMGVAGQVFDEVGEPLLNKVVLIHGKINGITIENLGITGVPEADIYGPGGYEIKISDHVFASDDLLSIQVFDLNGSPISKIVAIKTLQDCDKNLIIINFKLKD
jgi:hypothetical protein